MKAATSLGLLVAVAVATPMLALWNDANDDVQDPQQVEWQKHVDKACNARRYAIRVAAAGKLAEGGDAAVPAIRAYAKQHGVNALPESIVIKLAEADARGEQVAALLKDWATDDDFYWRSTAMYGLALRGGDRELFERYADDTAWKMRVYSRLGLALTGDDVTAVASRPEPDPRARVLLARELLDRGRTPPLQPLFDALDDRRTFLGVPWGQQLALEASKVLKRWLGDDFPSELTDDPDKRRELIAAMIAAAEAKSGQQIAMPEPRADADADEIAGGFEILSCKHGDVFVRWTNDGTLRFGIQGDRTVALPADAWQQLSKDRTAIALEKNAGVVICDNLRIRLHEPDVHAKIAPDNLPAAAADWLKRLAQRLEDVGETGIADELRRGLGQFEGR